jgi:HEAT repeat protein
MVTFLKIRSKKTVSALRKALHDDDPEVRLYAEEALKRLGEDKKSRNGL